MCLETPPSVCLETPPGCGPGNPLLTRPLNFPPGCGPGDLQCMLGYHTPPCEQNHRHLPATSFAGGKNMITTKTRLQQTDRFLSFTTASKFSRQTLQIKLRSSDFRFCQNFINGAFHVEFATVLKVRSVFCCSYCFSFLCCQNYRRKFY